MPKAAALALAFLGAVGCTARPITTAAPPPSASSRFIVPTALANGRIELALQPAYSLDGMATIPITLVATRGSIAGPIAAKIVASGINEGGAPAEALVRVLVATTVTATAGRSQVTSVSWDGRDEKGRVVPADAYTLILEFRVDDGRPTQTATATATLQMNGP